MSDLARQRPAAEAGRRRHGSGGAVYTETTTTVRQTTVTGRTYTATRPRGFAPWKPRKDSLELVDDVTEQLEAWRPQWPLTARQIFYGLVARGRLDKTESGYKRLLNVLNRGRRAGMIPWEAIRDDGANYLKPRAYSDVASFWDAVHHTADTFRLDRLEGQPRRLEVWCEAAGMLPQMERAATDYGAPVASSGGFDSTTAKHEAAMRFRRLGVPVVVLHIGDYDPSGCSIVDSVAEDLAAFGADVEFRRLAVTPEQIVSMDLPTALPKAKDNRGETMTETVQAEAIPPDALARLVQSAIEDLLDLGIRDEVLALEAAEREALVARVAEVAP